MTELMKDPENFSPAAAVDHPQPELAVINEGGTLPRVVVPEDAKFLITDPTTDPEAAPDSFGYYDAKSGDRLTNFTMPLLSEEQRINGDVETYYSFKIFIGAEQLDLRISVADFTSDRKLPRAIEDVCGARARIFCKPKVLRDAIREHMEAVTYSRRRVAYDFGWDGDLESYRFPSGSVSRAGYRPLHDGDVRIDLSDAGFARRLDLKAPPEDLAGLQTHVWHDLLGVHDRRVTLSLLGAAGAAVLYPFLEGYNRFALWLVGKSGSGKSYTAQLFLNLFGNFPLTKGFLPTWNGTAGSIEQEGYECKDAIFPVDDFKWEVIDSVEDVVTLLQNYADGTGRGRLQGGGDRLAPTRAIRGMLISTGEVVPEHSASTLARMIVVRVPEDGKDVQRGNRCRERAQDYRGLTAAFIAHLLGTGRVEKFAAEVDFWRDHFHDGIDAAPNGLRVAANVAVMAAALAEWAGFLKGAVPEADAAIASFIENDLMVLRDEALALIRGTGGQPTYLDMLNELVREERSDGKGLVFIGDRIVGKRLSQEVVAVSIPWSLEEVNKAMTKRGWPAFEGTHAQLMEELRDQGVLCDDKGRVIPKEATVASKPVWVERRLTRSFLIRSEALRLA